MLLTLLIYRRSSLCHSRELEKKRQEEEAQKTTAMLEQIKKGSEIAANLGGIENLETLGLVQ